MATPHIAAEAGDFAPTVLMPGDPKRTVRIAHEILEDAQQITDIRGMVGFTGRYEGVPLSIMSSGIGQPSMTLYATELFKFYGVKRIIRVGTCGALQAEIQIGDIVLPMSAHTDSRINQSRIPEVFWAPTASWPLLLAAATAAENLAARTQLHIGPICTVDRFYDSPTGMNEQLAAFGTLAVEMETAALYSTAAAFEAEALAVLTVSDHLFAPGSNMSAEKREETFSHSLPLALAAAFAKPHPQALSHNVTVRPK